MNGKSISITTSRNTATPVATAINSSSTNANKRAQPDYRVLPAVKHDPHLGWGSFNIERHGPLENANLRPIWNPQRCDWALRNQEGHPWQAGLFNGVALLAAAGGRVNALLDNIKKLPAAISPLIVAPYEAKNGPEA